MWFGGSIILQSVLVLHLEGNCYLLRNGSTSPGDNSATKWRLNDLSNIVNGRRPDRGVRLASSQWDSSTKELTSLDDTGIERTLNLPETIWPKRRNFIRAAIERQIRIQKFWKDNDVYRQLLERRLSIFENKNFSEAKATKFTRVILDGPPYANGDAHYGHFLNKTIKDVLLKAALLEGKLGLFLPGWDCHGIPIESKVLSTTEHTLGDLRNGLSDAGVPRAVEVRQKCSQVAFRSIQSQTDTFERAGIWGFWKEFYATYHFYYEKKVMDAFRELHDKELIYRARCPQHYSTMSRSVLADSELLSEECDVLTALVSFEIIEPKTVLETLDFHRPLAAVKLVCWTTLPWTLPGNRGLMLNGDIEYNVFYRDGNLYVLNNNEEFQLFQPKHHIGKIKGDVLVGLSILNHVTGNEYKVHDHSGVVDNKGTGIIHAAPAHGLLDFRILSKHKTFTVRDTYVNDPNVICNIIDEDERYYSGLNPLLDGTSIHDVDATKLDMLLGDDLLQTRIQRIPVDVDWRYGNRTHTRITKQWCISLRERGACLERLRDIKMYPNASRNYLHNIIKHRTQDWCISRQRIWGTPIPIAYVDAAALDTEDISKLCNLDELCEGMKTGEYRVEVDIETLPNYELGDRVFRKLNFRTDTVDVWFESALAQRVTIKRLQEILREMSKRCARQSAFKFHDLAPEYAVEGQDQFRGWYQSSLLLNTLLDGNSPAFARRVITHGFVNDNSGCKLSKRNQRSVDADAQGTTQSDTKGDSPSQNEIRPSNELGAAAKHSTETSDSTATGLMTMLGAEYYEDDELLDLDTPKCVGADVLRLWACSNDFLQKDIQLNSTNLREARDFARKVMNFCKYAIGVTHDCKIKNDRCRIRVSNFNLLDMYFLKMSFELVRECRLYFRDGRFHKVVRALEIFLTKFSNVYISYSKDTLYCDVKHGYKRTAVQIIIRKILRNVLGVVAPLMPHMAEDVFQIISQLPHQQTKRDHNNTVLSVFGERWRKMPLYVERVDVGGIGDALQLRNLVNSMNMKTDDHELVVDCDNDDVLKHMLQLETKHKLDLRILLNVSEVKLMVQPENGKDDKIRKRGNGYTIILTPAKFAKCRRCWLYRPDVTHGFCERCSAICTLKCTEYDNVPLLVSEENDAVSDNNVVSEATDDRTSPLREKLIIPFEEDDDIDDITDVSDSDDIVLEGNPSAEDYSMEEPPLRPLDPTLFK